MRRIFFLLLLGIFIVSPLDRGLRDFTCYTVDVSFVFTAFILTFFMKKSGRITLILILFLVLYCSIVFSTFFSVDPNLTRIASVQVFSALLLFYICSLYLQKDEKKEVEKGVFGTSCLGPSATIAVS